MRVIAGEMKGRHLKTVPGKKTRPTSDKLKESIFQIIGPFFNGGTCLDLFAGSGSLGLEALSRGMEKAIFIDKNRQAIHTIHKNITALNLQNRTEVYLNHADRALNALEKRKLPFDLIFIDPPYGKIVYEDILDKIALLHLIKVNGIIYCEHDAQEVLTVNPKFYERLKYDKYGQTTAITILKRL